MGPQLKRSFNKKIMMRKMTSSCPECQELVEGIWWQGGSLIVFEHKKLTDGKQHHYKLSVEKEPARGFFDRRE